MTDIANENPAQGPQAPAPHPMLRNLDVLEGTWQLEGSDLNGASPSVGTLSRRWLPGGHFLVQEMSVDGQTHPGIEYIGYDHVRGSLRSLLFSDEGPGPFCSFALEYFWQIEGDGLIIWHGEEGSPARFSGTIDRARGVVEGQWEWPGGGYRATSTRVEPPAATA